MLLEFDRQNDTASLVVPVRTLYEYFTQPSILSIPEWQREYSWDSDEQVDQLLEDLRDFASDRGDDEYLLGSVILCKSGSHGEKYVIDGQQRTVTLYLLFTCLYRYIHINGLAGDAHLNVPASLYAMLRKVTANSPEGKMRVTYANKTNANALDAVGTWCLTSNDEVANAMLEAFERTNTSSNLVEVLKHIYSKIEDGSWIGTAENLLPAIQKIFSSVKVIEIGLDSERDAIELFDLVNHRGKPLSDSDIIKGQIFRRVKDEDFQEISHNWSEMAETLRQIKNEKVADPKFLLRAIAARTSGKVKYSELAEEFGDDFFVSEKSPNGVKPLDFAESLVSEAKALKLLVESKDFQNVPIPHNFVGAFGKSIQQFPLLLESNRFSTPESRELLQNQVAVRTLFFILSLESPQYFESDVFNWVKEIGGLPSDADPVKFTEVYESFRPEQSPFWPAFEESISLWRYDVSKDKKRQRIALSYMSWWVGRLRGNEPRIESYFKTRKVKGSKFGWDVDHVHARANSTGEIPSELIESIGNLVLLCPSDNRSKGNAPVPDKIADYTSSHLLMTKSLGADLGAHDGNCMKKLYRDLGIEPSWDLTNWTLRSIESRTEFYTKFLIAIIEMKLPFPKEAIEEHLL